MKYWFSAMREPIHTPLVVADQVALDAVAVGAVAARPPLVRPLGRVLAAILVEEDPARRAALDHVVRDHVVARAVHCDALAAGAEVAVLDAVEVERNAFGHDVAEAVAADRVARDDVVLRARFEIDADAAREGDVEIAQRHARHVAVDEDSAAARRIQVAVLDDDVREGVLVLGAFRERLEALARDAHVVEEARDDAVAHRHVRERRRDRRCDEDPAARRARRVFDARPAAVEHDVRRADLDAPRVRAARIEVRARRKDDRLVRAIAADERRIRGGLCDERRQRPLSRARRAAGAGDEKAEAHVRDSALPDPHRLVSRSRPSILSQQISARARDVHRGARACC